MCGRVFGRRLEEAGEHGAFGKVEILHLLAEIEFRRRADTERAAAHIGAVQIELQDLALREVRLEPEREIGLLDLALQRALVGEEEVLGELLGDGGAALHDAARPGVLHQRAEGAHDVDAEMLEEAAVLRRDHRLDEVVRQVLELDGIVLQDAALADDVAIAVEEGDGEIRLLAPVGMNLVEGGDGEGEEDERAEHAERIALGRELEEPAAQAVGVEAVHEVAQALVAVEEAVAGPMQRGIDP